jgi:hypothetical protein
MKQRKISSGILTLEEHLTNMEAKHGTIQRAADHFGITPTYWYKLRTGDKTNPSQKILDKLGLSEIRIYKLKK